MRGARFRRTLGLLGDRGRALLAAGVTLSAAGIVLGFVDLVRAGALCIALVIVAIGLLRHSRPELEVKRHATPFPLTVDHTSRIELTVVHHGRRRLPPTTGEDALGPAMGGDEGAVAHVLVPACSPGGSVALTYDVTPRRRGRHTVGPLALITSDPFGLGTVRWVTATLTEVVVLPRVRDLAPVRVTVGEGGTSDPVRVGASHGASEDSIREYRAGDDLRRIHWPVTAHRGDLMVREESAPSRRRAVLALDLPEAEPDLGPRVAREAALDWMVEALASCATHLAALDHELHLVTPERAATGQALDSVAVDAAVHGLAVLAPDPAGDDLGPRHLGVDRPVVAALRELAAGGGLVVAATTDADPTAARDLVAARTPSTAGLLFVLDVASFGGEHGRGRRSGRDGPDAASLVAEARAGGWAARAVRGDDDVADAWAALTIQDGP